MDKDMKNPFKDKKDDKAKDVKKFPKVDEKGKKKK